jgi:ABC-type glycerol-3-phosphate transport system substrate-binding protein
LDALRGRITRRQTVVGAAAAALAAAGGAVLSGCGKAGAPGQSSAANGPLPVPQSGVVHLYFQANHQGSVGWNKTTQTIFQEFVDQNFNNNPKYKGIWATAMDWGNASGQITATLAGSGYADVFHMCCSDIPTLERQGFVQPLDDLLKQDNISLDLWSKGHILADSYDGKVYGLPSYDGTLCIIYRQDLLDELGLEYPDPNWTWQQAQQLWQQCTGTVKGTNRHRYGVSLYWNSPYEMIDWWLRGWGAREMNDAQDTATMASPQGIECLTWAQQLFTSQVATNRGDLNLLLNETAVFGQYHSAFVINAATQLGTKYKWDFLPNPIWPAGRTTFVTIDCYMLNSQTKHPKEAWTLLKWITGAEGDLAWPQFQIQINLITPALKSLWDYWRNLIQQFAPPLQGKALQWWSEPSEKGYAYPTIFFKYNPNQANNIVNQWVSQILSGAVSPQLGLQQMQQQINALQALGAQQAQSLVGAKQKFPTTGPEMAAVPTGI